MSKRTKKIIKHNFFRFSIAKLIISMLITFIGYYILSFAVGCGLSMTITPTCIFMALLLFTVGLGYFIGGATYYSIFRVDYLHTVWIVLFQLLWSYLIACVIMAIFRKHKK